LWVKATLGRDKGFKVKDEGPDLITGQLVGSDWYTPGTHYMISEEGVSKGQARARRID